MNSGNGLGGGESRKDDCLRRWRNEAGRVGGCYRP